MSVEQDIAPVEAEIPSASSSYYRVFLSTILSNGHLAYSDQVSDNGPFSEHMTRLGGQDIFAPSTLSAATTIDGYVSLIAQDARSHNIIYFAEAPTSSGDRFGLPVDLGRPDSVSSFGQARLISGLNGLSNVFALASGDNGTIWWKYHNPLVVVETQETVIPPGTDTPVEVTVDVLEPPATPWSDWVELPGGLNSLTAANFADGRILLAGINAGRTPYINMQTGNNPLGVESWSGWSSLIDGAVVALDQLEVAVDSNALIHIFGRSGSRIYMKTQLGVSQDAFTEWVLFAAFDAPIQTMSVGNNDDASLYVTAHVGTGVDSPIYSMRQVAGTSAAWTTPRIATYVRTAGNTATALFPNADSALNLFVLDETDHTLTYTTQTPGKFWQSGWKPITESVVNFSVTQDVTPNQLAPETE